MTKTRIKCTAFLCKDLATHKIINIDDKAIASLCPMHVKKNPLKAWRLKAIKI